MDQSDSLRYLPVSKGIDLNWLFEIFALYDFYLRAIHLNTSPLRGQKFKQWKNKKKTFTFKKSKIKNIDF